MEEDIEADDSLPVTLQLNEGGAGTVNVDGFSGDASYAGNNVNFSMMGVTFASYGWSAQK